MIYKTNKVEIHIQSQDVKIINYRENSKVYRLKTINFYRLLKYGEEQLASSHKNTSLVLLFNTKEHPGGKHFYSSQNVINTYIPTDTYHKILQDIVSTFRRIEREDKGVNMSIDKYLSPKEAANLLGVSTHLLQKWRSLGVGIPYIKLGESTSSAIRYQKSDLQKYLQENKIKTM